MHLLSKTLGKTYHNPGGEGPVGVAPPRDGEGSVDPLWEASFTKDHLQCLVSMMQLKSK